MLKSKIYYASVTNIELYYEGSITIDREIIKAASLLPGEKVEVLNLNTGARFETYVIEGKAGSGVITLNGPAARLGWKGDKLIILSYILVSEEEAKKFKPEIVELDERNRVKTTYLAR